MPNGAVSGTCMSRPVAATKAGDLFEIDYGPLGQLKFRFV
jgi:hypothetical protein